MADPDYYQVLGVNRQATAEEIRKAYRKLARENHPDVKKNDAAAATRFQQIQEAYDVLGDAKKRGQYDQFGHAFKQAGQAGPSGGTWSGGQVDLGDLFGQGGFSFEDLLGGATSGGRKRSRQRPGRDLEATIRVPFLTAARGGTIDVQLNRDGTTETLGVRIPAGVTDGSVMRLAGQGAPSPNGGPPGDVRLTVQVDPHRYFRRDGNDLLLDVPITPSEAVLGAKLDVPTLDEGTVVMTIPPGTSSGMKLRLRGKGLVDPQTKQPGDQYVVVKIVVPKTASDALQTAYRTVQPLEPSPRAGLW